jgi:HK97 gp10 family phage protein
MSVTSNIDQVQQQLATIRVAVREAIVRSLHESGLIVRARAVVKAPVSAGQLRASITHEVDAAALTVTVGSTAMHAVYQETGTRPGYGPNAGSGRGMPPEGSLLRWVMRTFGVGQKEGEGIEFLVRRKIQREGTKPQPFLGPAWEESRGDIAAAFERNLASVTK